MNIIASNSDWVDIGAADDFPLGYQGAIRVKNHTIALFRLNSGEFYAVNNTCPHQGYPLSKGTYEIRIVNHRVLVTTQERQSDTQKAAYLAQLHAGIYHQRTGQIARSIVRLLKEDTSPESLYQVGVEYDAERGEYGLTHASGFAVDLLRLSSKYPSHDPAWPLMKLFDFLTHQHVRQPQRTISNPLPPKGTFDSVCAEIIDDIEKEQLQPAEAKLRGLIHAQTPLASLEACFIQLCCRHFYRFGHGLIFVAKVFDAFKDLDDKAPATILPALLYSLGTGTREDTIPNWKPFRCLIDQIQPQFDDWWTRSVRGQPLKNPSGFRRALDQNTLSTSFDALAIELHAGTDPIYIIDELSIFAAQRLLRFDLQIDANPNITDGWLSVTHGLTFVNAVRWAYPRLKSPEVLHLLFQSIRFIGGSKNLCSNEMNISIHQGGYNLRPSPLLVPAGWADTQSVHTSSEVQDLDLAIKAIVSRQSNLAVHRCLHFLRNADHLNQLEAALYPYLLSDQFIRPIIYAHVIKTTVAAFKETRTLIRNQQILNPFLPVLGAIRFISSPINEAHITQDLNEAKRLILECKPPKRLFN